MPAADDTLPFEAFGPPYDFPRFGAVPRVYMIASTPRSGSHFLGHLLFATGDLGCPLEYFRPDAFQQWGRFLRSSAPSEIVREIMARRTSPSGWFGFKVHWDQFRFMRSLSLAASAMPISRVIWIRRRDLLDQAISLLIARQTGAWISFQEERRAASYSAHRIRNTMRWLADSETQWRRFFRSAGLSPRVVLYEDLVGDPGVQVNALLTWFGLPPSQRKIASLTAKQATERNAAWKKRFLAENGPPRPVEVAA